MTIAFFRIEDTVVSCVYVNTFQLHVHVHVIPDLNIYKLIQNNMHFSPLLKLVQMSVTLMVQLHI